MSSERLYTEAEAVEIIRRALRDRGSETMPTGLTQNDLWRIAEEAGVSRSQFESALARSGNKSEIVQTKNPYRRENFAASVPGELAPDDFIIVDESIPVSFGARKVTQEGNSMKMRLQVGVSAVHAVVASRKGQTSIRVHTSPADALLPSFFLMIFTMMGGAISIGKGHTQLGLILFVLAPIVALCLSIGLAQKARNGTQEFASDLVEAVTKTIADQATNEAQDGLDERSLQSRVSVEAPIIKK